MSSKTKQLIRESIMRKLPQDRISTADIATGFWSSADVDTKVNDIEEIVNELLIEELIKAELYMANADQDEIAEYRDERISELIRKPEQHWRWYCVTCGKLNTQTVNHLNIEDDRYCECE